MQDCIGFTAFLVVLLMYGAAFCQESNGVVRDFICLFRVFARLDGGFRVGGFRDRFLLPGTFAGYVFNGPRTPNVSEQSLEKYLTPPPYKPL